MITRTRVLAAAIVGALLLTVGLALQFFTAHDAICVPATITTLPIGTELPGGLELVEDPAGAYQPCFVQHGIFTR